MGNGNYETVIGLEVHVELSTKTKIFCGCSTEFGAPPNTNVCPGCLAMPGSLPVLNKQAVEYGMRASLALNCEINLENKFDRKHYFYPDLAAAYQKSQFYMPIGVNGWIDIDVDGVKKRIRVNRVHLEEDASKLTHSDYDDGSLVDYNRGGMPLIEIVSEADMRSPAEARAYLEKLKAIIQYTGVSNVKMEEGSLRCDANVSLRPIGQEKFGTKRELKNMNSFRTAERAMEYEVEKQAEMLNNGEKITQQTLRWDEAKGVTIAMRSKEAAEDYRYFPDPDLVLVKLTNEWVERVRADLPELPDARMARYVEQYGLSGYDAGILTSSRELADFYEGSIAVSADYKSVANWMMGDLLAYLNTENIEVKDLVLKPSALGEMIELINNGTISGKIAKTVFEEMLVSGKDPATIVKEKGLVQISDESELVAVIAQVVADNPQSVEDYKGGKAQAFGFLVGQVMKETRGKANPQLVNKLLKEKLG
jgi:aspartyl-tRNA(Asn)/glutamyl-tRNA(Gln) amidotransferase subunit B